MSELKSKPPQKQKTDLDTFLSGAEQRAKQTSSNQKVIYPWEEIGIREDVTKIYNLRLSEPYLLKLKYIAEHTPNSMQKFCLNIIQQAIDKEISRLTK